MRASRFHPVLEAQVQGTIRRWRWLRFWRDLGIISTAVWAAALLLGLGMWKGWLRTPAVVFPAIGLLVLAGGFGLILIGSVSLALRRSRSWAARAIEELNPALLDRLNTLTFLEARRDEPEVAPYFSRIEEQARDAVPWGLAARPFSSRPALLAWTAWAVVCAATVMFYSRTDPFDRLEFGYGHDEKGEETLPPDPASLELAKPSAVAKEQKAWGEVRITEPGRDLQVTKVDVVPLQIEAASSDSLASARWFSAVGGGAANPHALPAPSEPNYAVYKPLVYVDEFRLSDWDVLSYYASASTRGGASYASEIFFLEVRPFREDILKLTGGEGTPAYQLLGELSALVARQKHVLRETHRHLQTPYEQPELRRQDREKLAAAESDLGQAARHLYARIAAEMENTDVGVVLDQLARASEALDDATQTLRHEGAPVPPEQKALSELVLTRKAFQKALSDGKGRDGSAAEPGEELVTAELPDKLKEVAEFRNEQKAVKEQLQELAARQTRLAEQARKSAADQLPGLAAEEDTIARDLREVASAHPRAWKGLDDEKAKADQTLARAANAMREASPQAAGEAQAAGAALGALEKAIGRQADARGLAEAYRLKELVDAHARALARIEEKPEGFPEERVAAAVAGARDTTRELKKLVEETPAGDAFGPPLHEAVRTGEQERREQALQAVPEAEGPHERRRAAAVGRRSLEDLSQAFEQSAPSAARGSGDPLQASGHDALALALRQLKSLAAAEADGHESSAKDRAKQRREALHNLRLGTEALYGKDPKAADFLVKVDQALKGDHVKVDAARLRRLLDQIERFRVEMSTGTQARGKDARARHIDPAHLPSAYRDRIQRYFQQLSEEDRP